MLTGSALEVVALLLAPPIGLLALAFSSSLRESVVARRVLAVIAVLALVEIVLVFMVFATIRGP